MKSEKAEEYLSRHECRYPMSGYYTPQDAEKAIEIAEQEAEDRMREKAIEAFCKACLVFDTTSCTVDCPKRNFFLQKLNE